MNCADEQSGYHVEGNNETTHPIPNSSQFVFPTICAPEVRSSCTTVASYGEEKSARRSGLVGKSDGIMGAPLSVRDEHVVGMSEVHMLSFTATVIPASGPSGEVCVDPGSFARCTKALIRALRVSARVA